MPKTTQHWQTSPTAGVRCGRLTAYQLLEVNVLHNRKTQIPADLAVKALAKWKFGAIPRQAWARDVAA